MKKKVFLTLGTLCMCLYGLMYNWTVYSEAVCKDFCCSLAQFNTVFSVCLIFFALGGLISGFLYGKIDYRLSMAVASLAMGIGIIASSFSPKIEWVYLLYGVLFGFAAGFSYRTLLTCIISWFPEAAGFASGVLLMGTGLTAFVFNVPTSYMIQSRGWRFALCSLGVIVLVITMVSALAIVPSKEKTAPGRQEGTDGDGEYTVTEMVRNPKFLLFFPLSVLLLATCTTVFGNSNAIAISFGTTATTAAAITMVISLFNTSGRVVFGIIFDRKGRKTTMAISMAFFLAGVVLLFAAMSSRSLALLGVAFGFIGICFGSVPSIASTYILTTFGRRHYPENFSVQGMYSFFSSFIGSSFLSVLLAKYNNYPQAIRFLGVYACVAAVLYLTLELWFRKDKQNKFNRLTGRFRK